MIDTQHDSYFSLAAVEAAKATCSRARCGSVIVDQDGKVLGSGFNAPPLGDESQRMCDAELDLSVKPKYDKTYCIHAEWNAILNALRDYGEAVQGSTLYFMRLDEQGNYTDAGEPFCTVCSRLALQSGVKYFALWNSYGPEVYTSEQYNQKSYEYYRKKD